MLGQCGKLSFSSSSPLQREKTVSMGIFSAAVLERSREAEKLRSREGPDNRRNGKLENSTSNSQLFKLFKLEVLNLWSLSVIVRSAGAIGYCSFRTKRHPAFINFIQVHIKFTLSLINLVDFKFIFSLFTI